MKNQNKENVPAVTAKGTEVLPGRKSLGLSARNTSASLTAKTTRSPSATLPTKTNRSPVVLGTRTVLGNRNENKPAPKGICLASLSKTLPQLQNPEKLESKKVEKVLQGRNENR